MSKYKAQLLCGFLGLLVATSSPTTIHGISTTQKIARTSVKSVGMLCKWYFYAKPYCDFIHRMYYRLLCERCDLSELNSLTSEIAKNLHLKPIGQRTVNLTHSLKINPDNILVYNNINCSTCAINLSNNKSLIILGSNFSYARNTGQQFAILGHELVHIKNNDSTNNLIASFVVPFAIDAIRYTVRLFFKYHQIGQSKGAMITNTILNVLRIPLTFLTLRSINRTTEKRADLLSAEAGSSAQELISFFEERKGFPPQNRSERIQKYRSEFFDKHPTIEQRIKYLTPIAEEQARQSH